jgi:hypothetical protein
MNYIFAILAVEPYLIYEPQTKKKSIWSYGSTAICHLCTQKFWYNLFLSLNCWTEGSRGSNPLSCSVCSQVVDRRCPLNNTERLTTDHSWEHACIVLRSLHVEDLFCRCWKRVGAMQLLQKNTCSVPTELSIIFLWQSKGVFFNYIIF